MALNWYCPFPLNTKKIAWDFQLSTGSAIFAHAICITRHPYTTVNMDLFGSFFREMSWWPGKKGDNVLCQLPGGLWMRGRNVHDLSHATSLLMENTSFVLGNAKCCAVQHGIHVWINFFVPIVSIPIRISQVVAHFKRNSSIDMMVVLRSGSKCIFGMCSDREVGTVTYQFHYLNIIGSPGTCAYETAMIVASRTIRAWKQYLDWQIFLLRNWMNSLYHENRWQNWRLLLDYSMEPSEATTVYSDYSSPLH